MASVQQYLLLFNLMLIFPTPFVNGIDYFYKMSKKEYVSIESCLAESENHQAVREFAKTCRFPKYIDLVAVDCLDQVLPGASIYEMFLKGRKDKVIFSTIYDCVINEVHCITDHDRKVTMRDYETCLKGLKEKYCKKEKSFWPF